MTSNEIKEHYRKNIKFEPTFIPPIGGQQCGIIFPPERMICEELDLKIECGYHRDTLANRLEMLAMLETFLDNIIK